MNSRYSTSPKKIQRNSSQKYSFAWHSPKKQQKILQLSTSYISQLKEIKKNQLAKCKYKKAKLSLQKITKIQQSVKEVKKRRLSLQHLKQKQDIKNAFEKQMNYFNRQWKTYFQKQKQRQRKAIKSFQVWQNVFKSRSRQKVQSKYLNQIKIKKNTLRNNRDQMRFNYIINHDCNVITGSKPSKRQLQKIKDQFEKSSNELRKRLQKVQQRKQQKIIAKKYKALMEKIEVNQNQRQRVFLREQMRLQKKYKNVLRILRHQQVMETNWLHSINQI